MHSIMSLSRDAILYHLLLTIIHLGGYYSAVSTIVCAPTSWHNVMHSEEMPFLTCATQALHHNIIILLVWNIDMHACLVHTIGDLATVRKVVHPARTKWYDIGLELELPVDTLDAIERSRGDDGDHLRDILKYWLKRDAPTPTSKALVDALKSAPVGESRLACDVEDKLYSLSNSRSFDKSMHTPLVPSRQYNFRLWMKVICILSFMLIFLVGLTLYSDYNHLLFRRVMYHMNLLDSKSLPFQDHKIFVGRELSKRLIIQEIYEQHPPIISIVGPPGFGKSTLAIHIGHAMVADGFVVNYVDMSEVSSKQALAEKILAGDAGIVAIKNIIVERLYVWARGLNYRTLLILDNCDVILHNTTDLQTVAEKLLESSPRLKILITSRKTVLQLNQFTYQLENLSSEASCTLLQSVTYHEGLNSITCKSIASLTGNVPLALQVVGAILSDVNSPDVMTIVHKLERDIIPTLSPEDLPVEKRVNASINLSYQYLTTELQNIGRYLANFPGSFDEEAACGILILITNNSITCSEIAKCLEELVKRSLLEYDRRRNRYQFHTLIREFFLVVNKEATGENETNHFLIHFRSFYTTVLQTHTEQFNDNHVQALTELDMERHNILHLLEYLGDPNLIMDDTFDLLNAVRTIRFSFDISFLKCRFTSSELLGPVSSIVEYLSQKLNLLLKQAVSETIFSYFWNYVHMIIYLADLEEELNGASKAVQVFTAEEHIIAIMEQEQSDEVSDSIVLFYRKLSDYYTLLQDHDKVKECHEKILRLTRKLSAECEPGKCQYNDIGKAYYTIGDYARSARFFQSALDLEGEKLTEMVRTDLMALLYLSYYKAHDTVEAENVLENLTALLPVVKAKPETEVYQFMYVLYRLIEIYELNGKLEEVGHLKDKLIKAVRQVGAKPTEDAMRTAQELAVYLLNANDYPEAADLAEFALQSFTHLSNKDQLKWELAQVQVTVGMAKLMNWNLSDGLDYMELAADYICENTLRSVPNPSYIEWQIVFYFALRGRLCPLQNMLKINVLPYGVRIIGVLFDVLLNMNTVEKYLIHNSKVENQALSHSKQMVVATGDIDHFLPFSVAHSFTSWLSVHISAIASVLALAVIWLGKFIINVTYITDKICLISYLAYCLWCCIASIVDYCREFIKFVLYVVILCAVNMCPSVIIHVLSSASHSFSPWLSLTMCVCFSFITMIWLEINALVFVFILISFCLLWYCITKVIHYCRLFFNLCDSILSCLDTITEWLLSVSSVCVFFSSLLAGIACHVLNRVLVIILLYYTLFSSYLLYTLWCNQFIA